MDTERLAVIDCSHLYRVFGRHMYDAAQRVLARNGWRYDIKTDCWFDPKSIN